VDGEEINVPIPKIMTVIQEFSVPKKIKDKLQVLCVCGELYVMRDKMLLRHTRTILNGEKGVVVPVDKAQEQL